MECGGPSDPAASPPPNGPRKVATPAPKFGVVGDVIVSFSSSSITLSKSPDGPTALSAFAPSLPKGFEFAANGLVKVGPDMAAASDVAVVVAKGLAAWAIYFNRSSARRFWK